MVLVQGSHSFKLHSLSYFLSVCMKVGKCALYASAMVQNPGPLDPLVNVVRNETQTSNSRSLLLNLPDSAQDNRVRRGRDGGGGGR